MNARLWREGEPLAVVCDAHGRPQSFRWAGHTYEVGRICNRWRAGDVWWREAMGTSLEAMGASPEAKPAGGHEYIKLATTEGLLCLLARDLGRDVWVMVRIYD